MNKQDCEQLVEEYVGWLRKGLSVEKLEEACELTTPFLDRHNDHLQIYAVKRDGKIMLSDDGYVLSDLRTSGLDLNTPKREAVLDAVLNGFGVRTDGRQILVEASQRNLGQRLHALVQAMLAVNDMFVMAQPRVAGFFWEDVKAFLDQHQIRYSPRVKISGRSGFDHAIDFLIPKSPTRPERFIQAINAPNKNTIGTYLFALGDTRNARGNGSEAYAFLNDHEREVGGDVIEALEAYQVKPALWSKRKDHLNALAG
ncbi:MAG: DUF1829 domain-containing protein [Elusimicrobia bacterium]|nr:DUF1829 domain-containing protein [Elusimicrobiota bacterium]